MTNRRPGFTVPGAAAAAARRGQELGVTHRWTKDQAKDNAHRGAAARWGKEATDEPLTRITRPNCPPRD